MSALPILKASELPESSKGHAWLIESLWADEAVGLIGGEPKTCKTFLTLAMAISVATGKPCLGRFPVKKTGAVLLYAAEDALSAIRSRLTGLCRRYQVPLETLQLYFISTTSLRLDRREDCINLAHTVEALRPAMLVLDPFVRLHRKDENLAQEIVPLLAILRELQRRYGCAVVLVHHAKKGASHMRAGQALRGSSEFHAWSDSGLYLRRRGERLHMTVEHRAHPAPEPMWLTLDTTDDHPALVIAQQEAGPEHADIDTRPPAEKVLATLTQTTRPVRVRELRELLRLRTSTLCATIETLQADGRVIKTSDGYLAANTTGQVETPPPIPPAQLPTGSVPKDQHAGPPTAEPVDPRQALFPFPAAR